MSNQTRSKIVSAFDAELRDAPLPPGLRALSVRAAMAAPRGGSARPSILALVAALVMAALVATLVVGSHLLRQAPGPAGSQTAPPGRSEAAVAYDQGHGVMLVFGGTGAPALGNPAVGDTWAWDGKFWTQLHPALSPAPRYYGAMAYDESRHDVVLYGGIGGRVTYQDTWIWNGAVWRQQHPAHEPGLGYSWQAPVMAFDPVSHTVLLAGFTNDYKAQAWAWNGIDWHLVTPPFVTTTGMLILDGGRQLITVTVDTTLDGGRAVWQTQAWDGSAWTNVETPFTPSLGPVVSSAYDATSGQLVVVNGTDTWTWDGARWTRQHPTLAPRSMGYMTYMPRLREVVSWGDVNGTDNALYGWNGQDWRLLAAGTEAQGQSGEGKGGYVAIVKPAEVAAVVHGLVTNTRPVLVPSFVPSVMYDAAVSGGADYFSVTYQSDLRDKEMTFGIVVPNPPPGGAASRDGYVKFRAALAMKTRHAGYAEYFVYDTSDPLAARWLMWIEPGSMTNPELAGAGVPYFLSSSGVTEAEFWQVANSLR